MAAPSENVLVAENIPQKASISACFAFLITLVLSVVVHLRVDWD